MISAPGGGDGLVQSVCMELGVVGRFPEIAQFLHSNVQLGVHNASERVRSPT